MAEPNTYMGMAVGLRAGRYINLGDVVTTAPTTGLIKGDIMLGWDGSSPTLGVCSSTAAQTIKWLHTNAMATKTFGRATIA